MTPTDKFKEYFEPILKNAGAEYVKMSDADRLDRLNADTRSKVTYPIAFVIRPKWAGFDQNSGMIATMFDVLFYVFLKGKTSDYDSQDEATQQAEQIVTNVGQTLFHDSKSYKCLFDLNTLKAEPVAYSIAAEAVWGYEARLKIGIFANDILC